MTIAVQTNNKTKLQVTLAYGATEKGNFEASLKKKEAKCNALGHEKHLLCALMLLCPTFLYSLPVIANDMERILRNTEFHEIWTQVSYTKHFSR